MPFNGSSRQGDGRLTIEDETKILDKLPPKKIQAFIEYLIDIQDARRARDHQMRSASSDGEKS